MWSSDIGTIAHVCAYTCICTDIHTTDKLLISQSETGNRERREGGSCDLRQGGRNELRLLTPFYKPPPAAAALERLSEEGRAGVKGKASNLLPSFPAERAGGSARPVPQPSLPSAVPRPLGGSWDLGSYITFKLSKGWELVSQYPSISSASAP